MELDVGEKIVLKIKQEPPEIIFNFIEDVSEMRLNSAFDILFEEAIKEVDK